MNLSGNELARDVDLDLDIDIDFDEEFIREFRASISKIRRGVNRCSSELKSVKQNLKQTSEEEIPKIERQNSRQAKEIVIHIKSEEH